MNDYRGEILLIRKEKIRKCIGQDFFAQKLYIELEPELAHLDSGWCKKPSFAVNEEDVEILDDEEVKNFIISSMKTCYLPQ